MKKVYRVIKFNQTVWLGTYIKKNKDLREIVKIDFEKYFFMSMNNTIFGKTMENVRKHRDINLATTKKRRSYLVSEPNCPEENLLAKEMKKTQITMSKPVYLGLSILNLNKTVMYEFWCDYINQNTVKKTFLYEYRQCPCP